MREANSSAFALLLQAIDTKQKKGKLSFSIIKSTMKASTGYKYGNFKEAWEKLENKYDSKEIPDLTVEVGKCYDRKMADTEDPKDFILALGIIREQLHVLGEAYDDKKFVRDMLSKLPKSKEEGQLSPCHVVKKDLEHRIKEDKTKVTVDVVNKELKDLYDELYPDREEANDEKKDDAALTGNNGQFKKKCFKCGKWGHPAKFCPDKKNHNGSSRDGNRKPRRFQGKCDHCGRIGHKKNDCWSLIGKGTNQQRQNGGNSRGNSGDGAYLDNLRGSVGCSKLLCAVFRR